MILQVSSRVEHLSIIPETSSLFLSNLNANEVVKREFTIFSAAMGLFRSWNNWEISLGTMIAGRTPDLDDLYSDGPHLGTYSYEIGQPNLKLERTISIESSLEYSTPKTKMRTIAAIVSPIHNVTLVIVNHSTLLEPKRGITWNWSIGWNTRPTSASLLDAAANDLTLFTFSGLRHVHFLDFLRRPHHCTHPSCQTQTYKKN